VRHLRQAGAAQADPPTLNPAHDSIVVRRQILAKEPAKLAELYAKLFAWDINTNNALNYRMVNTGSGR